MNNSTSLSARGITSQIEKPNSFWTKLFHRFKLRPPSRRIVTARDIADLNNHLRRDVGLEPRSEKADWRNYL